MKTDLPAAALPLLSSRQGIQRAALYPLPTIAVMALIVGVFFGWPYTIGIALAGTAVVAVGWIGARVALGKGHIQGAGSALLRLLAAVMIKWALFIALLIVALGVLQLPLLALLIGLVAGLGLQMWALYQQQMAHSKGN